MMALLKLMKVTSCRTIVFARDPEGFNEDDFDMDEPEPDWEVDEDPQLTVQLRVQRSLCPLVEPCNIPKRSSLPPAHEARRPQKLLRPDDGGAPTDIGSQAKDSDDTSPVENTNVDDQDALLTTKLASAIFGDGPLTRESSAVGYPVSLKSQANSTPTFDTYLAYMQRGVSNFGNLSVRHIWFGTFFGDDNASTTTTDADALSCVLLFPLPCASFKGTVRLAAFQQHQQQETLAADDRLRGVVEALPYESALHSFIVGDGDTVLRLFDDAKDREEITNIMVTRKDERLPGPSPADLSLQQYNRPPKDLHEFLLNHSCSSVGDAREEKSSEECQIVAHDCITQVPRNHQRYGHKVDGVVVISKWPVEICWMEAAKKDGGANTTKCLHDSRKLIKFMKDGHDMIQEKAELSTNDTTQVLAVIVQILKLRKVILAMAASTTRALASKTG
ncbi:hypothetical protein KI688_012998 [Linnemannia hyalina]|uniref:Uncharacterized protein n=1 Tax=Linnemannia hyalina TaxID=64524 RepID=A0A9P7XTN0_9FUNG|nr:hypothetical protein KI688_012998 [Linnemannia hyalina]